MEIDTIVSAIEYEANLASKPLDWTIGSSERQGKSWKVFVEPSQQNGQLDESLEGAAVWWPGPPRGTADVLSVVPEELQINLRFCTAEVPQAGRLRVYPIRFLDKLAEAWGSPFRGPRFFNCYENLKGNVATAIYRNPSSAQFDELRTGQRAAFGLLRYGFSFLWGPPGTGKTHTLGAMLSAFLLENPSARVLLLSTTNTAVDLALISVDKALEKLERRAPNAALCRTKCKRIGAHFRAQHYQGRQHLLPRPDEDLVQKLAQLEARRPDASDVAAYEVWKSAVEEIRNQMRVRARNVLQSSRLCAMTCTRGVFSYADIEEIGDFDLVVFDEASQVGLVHALPFLAVAKRVLFAGDPKQLEPIVIADDSDVKYWLGRSPFDLMRSTQANTVILTEQSRMSANICRVVGQTFYEGKLTVCKKAAADPAWIAERKLKKLPLIQDQPLRCMDVASEGQFHAGFRGYMREESAESIVSAVQSALVEAKSSEIAVLTPYRAQRSVIRRKLRSAGIRDVQVSTVHRAQGSEKRIIFFDPVLGNHEALTARLINVALSRAKARLVVWLSKGDLANAHLARIHVLMSMDTTGDATPLGEVLRHGKGWKEASKRKVSYQGRVYLLEGVDPTGERILLRDCATGEAKKFEKTLVLQKTSHEKDAPTMEHKLFPPAHSQEAIGNMTKATGALRTKASGRTEMAVPLGKHLRSLGSSKAVIASQVSYRDKTYEFLGFDPTGRKILLRESPNSPIRQFLLEFILQQTANEHAQADSEASRR